jgi:hypothetical protein
METMVRVSGSFYAFIVVSVVATQVAEDLNNGCFRASLRGAVLQYTVSARKARSEMNSRKHDTQRRIDIGANEPSELVEDHAIGIDDISRGKIRALCLIVPVVN